MAPGAILAGLILTPVVYAAAPVLAGMDLYGAARGQTVRVVVKGQGLSASTEIVTDLPGTLAVERTTPDQRSMVLAISVAASARPSTYQLRAKTAMGVSNALRFAVSAATEFREEESDAPQRIPATPAVVNGTLLGNDVDRYVVYGKGTERRRFEIEAQRLGSPARIQFRVYDAQGRLVGEGRHMIGGDAGLLLRFPHEGYYTVEVRDQSGRAPEGSFYRLKMGYGPM